MNVGGDFTPLTPEARFSPQAHVTRKARPDKLCRDQSPRGLHTRVRDIVEQVRKAVAGVAGELEGGESQ